MIPVRRHPEPSNFDRTVRQPGMAFLKRIGRHPTREDYKSAHAEYWKSSHSDLYNLYNGICAYCAQWTPRRKTPATINHSSVDHFIPKSEAPHLAYEWDNYRLARAKLNNNKGNSLHVMDPTEIMNGWFILDFSSFMVKPERGLRDYLRHRIKATIDILDLNHNDYVQERINILEAYVDQAQPYRFLEKKFPFIAYELKRQGLTKTDLKLRFGK